MSDIAERNGAPLTERAWHKVWVAAEDLANLIDCTVVRKQPGLFPPKPDPRDALIEFWQRHLAAEIDEHQAAKALLSEAREEWKGADAEATRLKRLLDQHLADENSAQAVNDRLREENEKLGTERAELHTTVEQIAELAGGTADRPESVRSAVEAMLADNIKWHVEADRLKNEQLKFKYNQRVRVGEHLGNVRGTTLTVLVKLDGGAVGWFVPGHVQAVDDGRLPSDPAGA